MKETLIAGLVILLIVGAAVWYIVRARASGKKCIGCPHAGNCSACGGGCGADSEN